MTTPEPEALMTGGAAGLAVAMTPGAVSALLLDLAAAHGARRALAAGLGVATVDGAYALAAALAGASAAALLAAIESAVALTAAAVLAIVGLRGLTRLGRSGTTARSGVGSRRPYRTFVGLTAVNPTTIAVFAAIVAGLADALASSVFSAAAFAAGAFGASLAWHAGLAVGGSLLGRLPEPARSVPAVLSPLLVLAFAVRFAVSA